MGEYRGEPIYKIVFMAKNEGDLRRPMEILGNAFDFCIQGTDQCGMVNGELINKAFNKGLAVQRLCAHLGMDVKNSIAYGDSMNDLEMLQAAGVGICMGNGSQALKQAADEVCPPVLEDGLYRSFLQHGLI